jgi:MSHA biogenesis protein MshJ
MSTPSALINMQSRFNAMTLRERAMVAVAALALLVLLWDQLLMNPLRVKQAQLTQEIATTREALQLLNETIQGRANDNPLSKAMEQKAQLSQSLAAVDSELQSAAAGLIPPGRMVQAMRDVLNQQRDLRLVSLRNLPVTSLVPPPPTNQLPLAQKTAAPAVTGGGPFVHSVEIVVEGSYLEVLNYLQKVEALPWKFYWQVLELKAAEYPTSRVRVRLNTLSMDKEWWGV